MPQLSISEAARAAGVDRATLYRHVKAGKLSLTRDEKGRRVVDASELCRVFPPVLQTVAVATAESVDLLQAKLEAAEEKCALLQHVNSGCSSSSWNCNSACCRRPSDHGQIDGQRRWQSCE
jgi:transposase-like protein